MAGVYFMKLMMYIKKDVRNFGIVVGIVILLLGTGCKFYSNQPIKPYEVLISLLIIVISIIYPRLFYWPYRLWMFLGRALGWLNTHIILFIVYYAVVTPMALVMRFWGYDPLMLKFDHSIKSYKLRITQRKSEHLTHQY